MTPVPESRTAATELDAEQEVDFARYWRAMLVRWWLPLAGVAAGLVIGYLASFGGHKTYEARAIVYLGEPLAPGGGGQLTGVSTNLALADQIVRSEGTIRRVASQVGLRPGQLRDRISTKPVLGITTGRIGAPAPIMAITVTGRPPRRVEAAADALGKIAIDRLSTYVDVKIQTLNERVAYDARQMEVVRRRLDLARKAQGEALDNTSLDPTERLIALLNFNSLVISSEGRLASLEQDQFPLKQLLTVARDIEHGRIIERAVAVGTTARSARNSMLVGALIGLVLGILAAVLWEPVLARIRARPA